MPLPNFNRRGLLPAGVHKASLSDVEERCVTPFGTSKTRKPIFDAFSIYQNDLASVGVNATQWVDGSFVDATRTDPSDVDVVNICDPAQLNALSPAAAIMATKLLDGGDATKPSYKAHTFLAVKFPPSHPYHKVYVARIAEWNRWFSTPMDYSGKVKVPAPHRGGKGIVEICVGNATLCPTP